MAFLLTKKENSQTVTYPSQNEKGVSSISLNGKKETFQIDPKKISISSIDLRDADSNSENLPIQVGISENTKMQLRLENIPSDFKVNFGKSQTKDSSAFKLFSDENGTNDLKISSDGKELSVVDCSLQLSPNEKTQAIEAKADSCVFQDSNNQLTNAQINLSIPQFWKNDGSVTSSSKSSGYASRSKKGGGCDFWCEFVKYCRTPTNTYTVSAGGCGRAYTQNGVNYCYDSMRTTYLCGGYTDFCSASANPCQ